MQSFFAGKMAVERAEGFQRAIGKPFGRLRRGETLRKTGKSKEGLSLAFHKKSVFFSRLPIAARGPEGFQRAIGKPPGRLRRGETLCKTESNKGIFSLPPTRNLFLVRGFVRLRADEVLSHTGKYPKGAGGGQRVHVSWPPPDPPLLRNSAPLASQGRAQLGSRPSLGGPLSPTAQLIPPPAFGRRSILGV